MSPARRAGRGEGGRPRIAANPELERDPLEEGLIPDEEDQDLAEEEARRVAGAVMPIRDVDDNFVFRFEVGPAILSQVLAKLNRLPEHPLVAVAAEGVRRYEGARQFPGVEKYRGFYQLFHRGLSKYIGKTSRPVGQRLREHALKMFGRQNLDLAEVTCRYIFVEDPSLVDMAEGALISHFGALAEWNTSGFGSKVPGSGRGGQRQSEWQAQFPPNLNVPVVAGSDTPMTLTQFVGQLSSRAPLTLSIPNSKRAEFRRVHAGVVIEEAPREMPWSEWVAVAERRLIYGWRIDRSDENWYITG